MVKYKKVSDLFEGLKDNVSKALKTERVIDEVRDAMVEAVKDEVYDEYITRAKPSERYIRKENKGGLADKKNIKAKEIKGDKLKVHVRNYRRDKGWMAEGYTDEDANILKGRLVDETVVNGHLKDKGWYYFSSKYDSEYKKPRNFYKTTVEYLDDTNRHITALKKELKKNGIKTK